MIASSVPVLAVPSPDRASAPGPCGLAQHSSPVSGEKEADVRRLFVIALAVLAAGVGPMLPAHAGTDDAVVDRIHQLHAAGW